MVTAAVALLAMASPTNRLTLWYDKPAAPGMNEALPVGNGRLGGLVYGDPAEERIVLNEDSLWTGDDNPTGEDGTMGAYQKLGELRIRLGHTDVTGYRRDLDLAKALAHVSYRSQGVTYKREVFSSHDARLLAVRLTTDEKRVIEATVSLHDGHEAPTIAFDGRRRRGQPTNTPSKSGFLVTQGVLSNGLNYETRVELLPEDGTLEVEGRSLRFRGKTLVVYVAARTDYAMVPAMRYRGNTNGLANRVFADFDPVRHASYAELREAHIKDYRRLFDRCALDLGPSTAEQRALPTDQRKLLADKTTDPELEQTLFQYGRYLLIASSRPGSLPANLQGLWNDSNSPPWHSDYHSNINVEMNYWPAETTNLAECHLPFFDLVRSQLPAWRKATAASDEWKPTTRGFAIRTSHNITGGMGWKWDKTANAWYALHFWDHYAFGGDKTYLRDVAYPYLKEVSEFWIDHLKTLPDGRVVVPKGWSPEHGPDEDGVSYNQEIVDELFKHTVAASEALGVDPDLRRKLNDLRAHLVRPGVGSWGQASRVDEGEEGAGRARHPTGPSPPHLSPLRPLPRLDPHRAKAEGGGEGLPHRAG